MGLAAARYLPEDQLVLLSGRSEGKLKKAAQELCAEGISASYQCADTSRRESVRALAQKAASMGEVTAVINAAGVSGSMAEPEKILRINALGTVYINQEFAKVMKSGCILDVCSNSAYTLPGFLIPERLYPLAVRNEEEFIAKMTKKSHMGKDKELHRQLAYCMSKNFVKWYVQNSAYKYACKGIRIVSVSPGFVNTDMGKLESSNPATDVCIRYSGLNRRAAPDELGFLLASVVDERNSYLVGVDILCDGGSISAGFNSKVSSKPDSCPEITENW